VRQLERTIPFVEGGAAREGVDEGMEGGKEEVECKGNVGDVGEVTKVRVDVSRGCYPSSLAPKTTRKTKSEKAKIPEIRGWRGAK
jgi:hypothetical protein